MEDTLKLETVLYVERFEMFYSLLWIITQCGSWSANISVPSWRARRISIRGLRRPPPTAAVSPAASPAAPASSDPVVALPHDSESSLPSGAERHPSSVELEVLLPSRPRSGDPFNSEWSISQSLVRNRSICGSTTVQNCGQRFLFHFHTNAVYIHTYIHILNK